MAKYIHNPYCKLIFLFLVFSGLFLAPFAFQSLTFLNLCAKIMVFIMLVLSYDLLIGYIGMVSFAHTLFFALGGYGVVLVVNEWGVGYSSLFLGLGMALVASIILACFIALLTIRVRAMYFSMVTLAITAATQQLVSQLYNITGGDDGISIKLPGILATQFELGSILGLAINGRMITYYIIWLVMVMVVYFMFSLVQSPFGLAIKAMGNNEQRTQALGYNPLAHRMASMVIAGVIATMAGACMALWLKYTGPDAVLSFDIMVDILLIITIGGMGNLYGGMFGVVVFLTLQFYLQIYLKVLYNATGHWALFNPERWLLWLGLVFIIIIYTNKFKKI